MLQQTQVATVIPYWQRWLERFPTVEALASADEQDVLSIWQGLGYYRRCRLLQQGARFVSVQGVPKTVDEWRQVPGVGAYTAGAIASIAQGTVAPLVDGNVERVYSRLSGDAATGPALNRNAWDWASRNVHQARPGAWNQALMELGATICTPTRPACNRCPVASGCLARREGRTEELPTKVAKAKPVGLQHVVWIPVFERMVGVRQIPMGSWWEGMWEFPRVELTPRPTGRRGASYSEPSHSPQVGEENAELRRIVGDGWLQYVGDLKHTVTNHRITIEVHLVRCEARSPELEWKDLRELQELPMPAPQRKALQISSALIG